MERIKLLMQNQDKLIKQNRLDRPYSGIIDCANHTFRNEGVLSFWRGNLVNVIRYTCTQACNFAFKDAIKYRLFGDTKSTAWKKSTYQEKFAKNIISGGVAGSFTQLLVYRGLYFGLYDSLKPIILRDNEKSFSLSFLLG